MELVLAVHSPGMAGPCCFVPPCFQSTSGYTYLIFSRALPPPKFYWAPPLLQGLAVPIRLL